MKRIDSSGVDKLLYIMQGLYTSSRFRMLRHILNNYYPADIALALKECKIIDVVNILRVADQSTQVYIFQYLPIEMELDIIPLLKEFEIRFYFENLPADDRTTLLREMDEELKEKVLRDLSKKERDIVDTLLAYDEDFAGAMATHGATTFFYSTVQETLDSIRIHANRIEDAHTIYVLNGEQELLGSIPLEKLIFSETSETIENIMSTDPIFIYANQPKEDAVDAIQKYDVVSLPIIDEDKKYIGIITYDDAMDLLVEEGSKHIYQFAGVSTKDISDAGYLEESVLLQVKRRFTWTIIPILMEIITGALIGKAENMLESVFILATFIPMIAAAGGNIGSQSASLVTRAIALKEVSFKNIFTVLKRELSVSILIALICCPILVLKMVIFPHPPTSVSFTLIILTVALALGLQLITSALLGAFVPLLAVKLKIDPAIMSSPVLASSVDIIGILIYFSIAKMLILGL